jgi:hypothetical protein
MNVRTITRYILAIALIAPAAGVFAAEQSSHGSPYSSGPDQAVMTTASNTEVTYLGDGVYVTKDRMLSPRYASLALETAPGSEKGSVGEVRSPPVVIESEVLNLDPTLDQLMQKFRTALGRPSVSSVSERRLANGALEVTTSLGRFCTTAPPGYIQSALGGNITLAAPCALF